MTTHMKVKESKAKLVGVDDEDNCMQTSVPVTSRYLLSALHISMTTSTDSAHVLALAAANVSQSMLGNILGSAGHCM